MLARITILPKQATSECQKPVISRLLLLTTRRINASSLPWASLIVCRVLFSCLPLCQNGTSSKSPGELGRAMIVSATAAAGGLTASSFQPFLSLPKDWLTSVVEWFGELLLFCSRLFRTLVNPPYEFGELLHQCDEISKSLPLVALAGAATGVVMSLQMRESRAVRPD